MAVIDGRTWLEHLSTPECWRLLALSPVGRVGVLVDSAPEIYPVNHVVDDQTVVASPSRSSPASRTRGVDVMRVLVMESDPYAADDAARELSAAGHDVVRCFERDLGNFPCNAAASQHPHHNHTHTETVTPESTVGAVLSSLAASGRDAALVVDDGVPVGVVTRRAMHGRPGAVPRRDAEVRDVMDWECVHTDPGADASSTLHTYTDAAWISLRRRGPCGDDALARRAAAFDQTPDT